MCAHIVNNYPVSVPMWHCWYGVTHLKSLNHFPFCFWCLYFFFSLPIKAYSCQCQMQNIQFILCSVHWKEGGNVWNIICFLVVCLVNKEKILLYIRFVSKEIFLLLFSCAIAIFTLWVFQFFFIEILLAWIMFLIKGKFRTILVKKGFLRIRKIKSKFKF